MSEETRITANPLPTETHITADQPSKPRISMKDGHCPKCGSADVIPNVSVLDNAGAPGYSNNVRAVVVQHPDAWMFTGEVRTCLKAWVCGSCGYTELYANNPAALLAAYRKREEQS
jgi:predicted nucleic-acid-binding Zn-ribbon protein